MVRIDMHLHTTRYSPCARLPVERLLEIVPDLPVDGLVITEHDILWPAEEVAELQSQVDGTFRFFKAVEVSTDVGHILAYNLRDDRDLEVGMPLSELAAIARDHEATLVMAHPGRFTALVPEGPPAAWQQIAAVEVMSNNIVEDMIPIVEQAVTALKKPHVANSDAHDEEIVGIYATEFPRMPANEAELARMIAEGAGVPWADEGRIRTLRLARPDRPILFRNPVA